MITEFKQINLWGEGDIEYDRRTGKKLFKSGFPAFCFPQKIEAMKDERDGLKARLNADPKMAGLAGGSMPLIDDRSRANVRADIRDLDDRIEARTKSKDDLDSKLRDQLYAIYKNMGALISEAMYSYTAQREGFVDSQKEFRRMTANLIPVNNDIVRWFKKCNVPLPDEDKKTNRKNLEMAWKILGHYVGEETNTETLRPRDPYAGQPIKSEVMAEQVD